MENTTVTTVWAIKRQNYYYAGTIGAPNDDYLRDSAGTIVGVATKAAAARIADAMATGSTYYLAHGEYSPPSYTPRRIASCRARIMPDALAHSLLLGE